MSDVIDEKEKLLLEYMLSSKELFIKVMNVIQPQFFEKPLDSVVEFCTGYFNKYHAVPDLDVIKVETGVKLKERELAQDEFDYCCDEVEKHCKWAAMKLAIFESADILGNEDEPDFNKIEQQIRKAISITLDKNLGLNLFESPALRLAMMEEAIDSRSIGWPSVDQVTDNVKRGEMFLLAANSGGGKSVFLANIANNMAKQGLNVCYVSLELNENLIAKRLDSILTGVGYSEIFERKEEIVQAYEILSNQYANITVKKMPAGSTANDVRAYLQEYHLQNGYNPDVMCLDYLDLLAPNVASKSAGRFDMDKAISEEFREILQDFEMYGFTASQLNRDSINVKEKSQAHIAGGLSKINTSDVSAAIIRDEEDVDNGVVHIQFIKIRSAPASSDKITLNWCNKTLLITDGYKAPKVTGSTTGNVRKLAKGKTGKGQSQDRLNEVLSKIKR